MREGAGVFRRYDLVTVSLRPLKDVWAGVISANRPSPANTGSSPNISRRNLNFEILAFMNSLGRLYNLHCQDSRTHFANICNCLKDTLSKLIAKRERQRGTKY